MGEQQGPQPQSKDRHQWFHTTEMLYKTIVLNPLCGAGTLAACKSRLCRSQFAPVCFTFIPVGFHSERQTARSLRHVVWWPDDCYTELWIKWSGYELPTHGIALCSWERHVTHVAPTQVYKWVLVNFFCWGSHVIDCSILTRGREKVDILLLIRPELGVYLL